MRQIEQLYYNESGMAFYWKKDGCVLQDRIQVIFRETGFYFSLEEMQCFKEHIVQAYTDNGCCSGCRKKRDCGKFLLKTPCAQIDLAVSDEELSAVHDLVEGTLFRIRTVRFIEEEGRN